MEENQEHIPDGWELESMGKVVSFSTGKKDVNQGNPEGDYPFFTCSKTFTFSDEYSLKQDMTGAFGRDERSWRQIKLTGDSIIISFP